MKDEALKLALEALEMAHELEEGYGIDFKKYGLEFDKDIRAKYATAITAIKQALAAPDLQAELDATNRQVEILSDALAESRREVAALKGVQDWKKLPPEEPPLVKWAKEQSAPVQEPVAPDYAWPTFADYEKDVGFKVNDAFKMAWTMARTTNALFTQMEKNTSMPPPAQPAPVQEPVAKPKLIGWRTADFLNETTDIHSAKNWEVHYEVLPIFEGDPNTKLATPPAAQRQWVGLTDDEIVKVLGAVRESISGNVFLAFARAIEAKLKEKNT